MPRPLTARPRFPNYQVRFVESAAVPVEVLERTSIETPWDESIQSFPQWRMDFPLADSQSFQDSAERQVLSIVEKILTRGRITLLAPDLEEKIVRLFGQADLSRTPLDRLLVLHPQPNQPFDWFDSAEEAIFYRETLPALMPQGWQPFVLPQVEIATLVPESSQSDSMGPQRVDFAVFHPEIKDRIVIEIDGSQHQDHAAADAHRDQVLRQNGYKVIRIPADSVAVAGRPQPLLQGELAPIVEAVRPQAAASSEMRIVQSIRLAHQVQIVFLQAIQSGFLDLRNPAGWYIESDLDALNVASADQSLEILRDTIDTFVDLLRRTARLYGVQVADGNPAIELVSLNSEPPSVDAIRICFAGAPTESIPTFYVANLYVPFHIAHASSSAAPGIPCQPEITADDLEYFLRYIFRKPAFWEGQFEGVLRVLRGKDALLLLPTGAGKSLVYQLASFLLPGRTIVIDPIISLMDDQIDNLAAMGIDRCVAITSQIENTDERARIISLFAQGEYLFVFVAPERLQTTEFRDSLRSLTVHTPVALIVVDEAHCVSEWGHDFRTAYLNIGRSSRAYCESCGHVPPLLALTGTASRSVLKDVQRELQIHDFDAIITPKTFSAYLQIIC